jgi:hypothetical protein
MILPVRSIARTGGGVAIAYSRAEFAGGPMRVFMREVYRTTPPRRRVAGH